MPALLLTAGVNDDELLFRGTTVFEGYWRPGASAAGLIDGWFRTGDLASRSSYRFR